MCTPITGRDMDRTWLTACRFRWESDVHACRSKRRAESLTTPAWIGKGLAGSSGDVGKEEAGGAA